MARVGTRGAGLSKDIALSVKNRLTHLGANVSDDLARLSGKVEDAFAYADGAVSKNIGKHNARVYQSNGGNWDEVASGILGSSGTGRKAAAGFSDDASQALAKHGDEVSRDLRHTGGGGRAGSEFASEAREAATKHGDDVASTSKGISKEEYKSLRKKTPSQEIRNHVNNIDGEKFDPIYGYRVETLEADHIVSMKEITEMDGFSSLSDVDKIEVLNLEDNFMGLGKPTNSSKRAKTWSEWQGHSTLGDIPAEIREKMIALEREARMKLQNEIFRRLKND